MSITLDNGGLTYIYEYANIYEKRETYMYKEELMLLKFAKLLFDYSINRKRVDENYISELFDIIINGKNLNEYVRDYRIIDECEKTGFKSQYSVASYNGETKIITLSKEGIDIVVKNQMKYSYLFSDIEYFLYINLLATQIILHELEHVNQEKLIHTGSDMESKILMISSAYDIKLIEKLVMSKKINPLVAFLYEYIKVEKYNNKYYKFYIYSPHERLAEIKSYQQIIDALSIFNQYSKRIIEFEKICKLENMIKGYDDYSFSPTILFLKKLKKQEQLKQFDWYSDNSEEALKLSMQHYSLEERLKYGLPASIYEQEMIKKYILSSIKYS